MFYKHFRFNILLRVLGITLVSLLLAYVLVQEEMLFVPVALAALLIGAIVNLVIYIEKSNRDLTHFLLSIRQGAYTESYPSQNRGKPFDDLSDAFNEVIGEFARLNEDKELHYQYLEALNENINVAILTFSEDGRLLRMNSAAKRLLRTPVIITLESFKNIDLQLYQTMTEIKPDQRRVVRVFLGEDQYQLNVQLKEILLQGKRMRVILIQNLSEELEAKEIEAWHQLMSVLTHEIMNSVTPLISLTAAVQSILGASGGEPKDLSKLSAENTEDIFSSLSTIQSRSKGLLSFVNAYKEYAKPIEVRLEQADLVVLTQRIIMLFSPDFQQHNIQSNIHCDKQSIIARMDTALMEQVIINILKNAIEATPHDGTGLISIVLKVKGDDHVSITISDNGAGMDSETQRRIFIPFFTTKSKGTGIGLSLSRQIMKLHNGSITVKSQPGTGTAFTIEWR
jgi:nitrogen fixation/metabolism regulation signal transduction histidine kinase